MANGLDDFGWDYLHVREGGLHIFMPGEWNAPKNEIKIAAWQPGFAPTYSLKLAFGIAMGDVGALKGRPACETLKSMADIVEAIISATEVEARKIGLIDT